MFFVFNKDKITAYVVTAFTVMVLFFTASVFNKSEESVTTSANETKMSTVDITIENKIEEENTVKNNRILNKN